MNTPIIKRLVVFCLCLFLSGIAVAQTQAKLSFKNTSIYAGIEVGSKGVKMSVLEKPEKAKDLGVFTVILDTSINTDFISFTEPTFNATVNALTELYNVANKRYAVPTEQIFTVISSGVQITAEKSDNLNWLTKLADAFKIQVNEPNREVKIIDVTEEARLSHLGIIPASRRYSTFLIDIGSGNTKGGYFPYSNTKDIRLFQLTWGTKSIANETEKRMNDDLTFSNYYRQMQRVLNGPADQEIVYAINVSGAYNMSDNIAFSGGIAWATATLLFPELIENAVVPVTYDEVAQFLERIANDYPSLNEEAIAKRITDKTVDLAFVKKQVKTVNKVFDQKALLAGGGLLLKIMRQFEGVYEKKQFYLVKNGQTGWISAYVNESVNK